MIYLYLNLFILFNKIYTDNIDTDFPIIFSYEKSGFKQSSGSYFGYSLSVNKVKDQNYVLIGSPRFDSKLYNVKNSGAIFHCQWNERDKRNNIPCSEIDISKATSDYFKIRRKSSYISDNMLLGLSLASNKSSFVSCAHTWVYDLQRGRGEPPPTPVGRCFNIYNNGVAVSSFEPIVTGEKTRQTFKRVTNNRIAPGRPLHSHLMTGFSLAFQNSGDELLMGSPGYFDFSGSIIRESEYIEDLMELDVLLRNNDQRLPSLNSYLGYALTIGQLGEQTDYIVMGAPRNQHFNGKVYLFPSNQPFENTLMQNFLITIEGNNDAKGEYFGASLLALDVNNDKVDDLIIGAPLYSDRRSRECGRVYVYLSSSGLEKVSQIMTGYEHNGRFGTALASIDINLDGFMDIIISAPYEQTNSASSTGAIYIYLGTLEGLDKIPYARIGAENFKNVGLNGFGSSIFSNNDFDSNGYNDILIGSYISENAVLIRTKPKASLIASTTFKPLKIRLHEKNCDNNFCFNVTYCVSYTGKFIRDRQKAVITLDVTDSKLSVRVIRAKIDSNKISQTKIVELRANQPNCFSSDKSFSIMVNRADSVIDIITPIELRLSVQLQNESSQVFCKQCPIAKSSSILSNIEFEHGCLSDKCVSNLILSAVSKYSGQEIKDNLIEGLHQNIDIDINVLNTGEASLNTMLTIKMSPILLNLTKDADWMRCKAYRNISLYRCDVNQILQKGEKEKLNLHFIISRTPTNNINIDFSVETKSTIQSGSKLDASMKFEIIREANIEVLGESYNNNITFSDKIQNVLFSVSYNLLKSGPSTVNSAFLQILLPTDVIELENESKNLCYMETHGYKMSYFREKNKTIDMTCSKDPEYCSAYLCKLPEFNSGEYTDRLTLSLALIPSYIKNRDYKAIHLILNSKIIVKDEVRFQSKIMSDTVVSTYFVRKIPIKDEQIEPWILFASSGVGIFVLIITIIILIKYGFFRRKKREELIRVKQRMSMKPNSYDIKELDEQLMNDENEDNLNETD